MHERTQKVMRAVRRKIGALVRKENDCHGQEGALTKALNARLDLEYFVRDEIEGLLKEIEAMKHAELVNRGPG